jgi:hypothetical protein
MPQVFAMPSGLCGHVLLQSLCTWLANTELRANRSDRRNSIPRKLLGEDLGRPLL